MRSTHAVKTVTRPVRSPVKERVPVAKEDSSSLVTAIQRSQAVIEFSLDGSLLTADDNFLNALGYSLPEIKGQHHRMFVEPEYQRSQEYLDFWKVLNRGEFFSGEFKRIGKGNRQVWIQATYNPIMDHSGRPYKIVKFATDITNQKRLSAGAQGQMMAIGRSQAVIEFDLDGTVLIANDNFLRTMGYHIEEIRGRHHSLFVDESYRNSDDYRGFWRKLSCG